MYALLLGTLLWATTGFAEDIPLELMSSCEVKETREVFSLYRDKNDPFVGALWDYDNNEAVEHLVNIQYTNAGARAIITSEDLPKLILIGTGKSTIHWNGKVWNCRSRF
ncbi:MAG: hypothetical protein AB7O96_13885 [Pseudobdellovibrionaceae bacterium]